MGTISRGVLEGRFGGSNKSGSVDASPRSSGTHFRCRRFEECMDPTRKSDDGAPCCWTKGINIGVGVGESRIGPITLDEIVSGESDTTLVFLSIAFVVGFHE